MREFSRAVLEVLHALPKRSAPDQGGLLTGQDPTKVNTNDPLRLWIVQLGVIILMTQLLSLVLRKMRQPRVISEVLGGIILGPTAFGRIPGFTKHIFPTDSRPYLNLVANIGLCLFLFLVGMEIDAMRIKRHARYAITVAAAGVCIPFGIGTAISVPIYHTFIDRSVNFTHYMLFNGVSYSITAFPVLCRILTELKLLDTTVGIVVLSAGVGTDLIGWTLLALVVALVNAGSGLTALWTLLICIGWALLLIFVVKYPLLWLARRTGSTRDGPSMLFMTVTMLLLFGSAFFTDIIGVHAIFGAFLVGIIVPREGGLTIALTEKLEDMVTIIFLPLYFALSGLSTDLGLLNTGKIWGFTIAIASLDYIGKFGACSIASRFAGFTWRESTTIGSLMSCKGLVELIVLNVALSAGILSQRVFSMFVLEALILTFMTTPAVTLLYPPKYRKRLTDLEGADSPASGVEAQWQDSGASGRGGEVVQKTRFTVVLDKLEHLPGMMALTQLVLPSLPPPAYTEAAHGANSSDTFKSSDAQANKGKQSALSAVSVDAIRLIELSDRTSDVMKSSMADSLITKDPALNIFSAFGALNGIRVNNSLAIVTFDDLGSSVTEHAQRQRSQLVLVPWLPPLYSGDTGSQRSTDASGTRDNHSPGGSPNLASPRIAQLQNPLEALFRSSAPENANTSVLHSQFVRNLFASAKTDVALFVDRHMSEGDQLPAASTYRLFVPFFGGPDDRLALEFAVQLCANPRVSAMVVRMTKHDLHLREIGSTAKSEIDADGQPSAEATIHHITLFPDTVYAAPTTQTRLQSETADSIAWARYTRPDASADPSLATALTRMVFTEAATATPLQHIIDTARSMSDSAQTGQSRLLVLTGRSRRLAAEDHHNELKSIMQEHGSVASEVRKTVGDVATSLVVSGCETSIVVVQAAVNA
ncbi:hypothetical protein PYCCODRAFT_1450191 [Trametes coccinea BRFM310]|uniref:Cation/H+ exchanger transmembrane domain-containing protein n=1 Tax=Trametes coccinea (strain BRFM310) TaxID=1353009 RepID=A0A1Y2IYI2_TRAC3|nr:hypothetical protein PYCCODRAFT_1450191 [Trametes coccinea BRFM310]